MLPGEEAALGGLPQAVRTAPWLIRQASECLPRGEARARWGEGERALVLVVAAGPPGEEGLAERWAAALREGLPAAQVELARGEPWPLLPWLAGVDLLVGAGGYNLVAEARATSTPLLGLAQSRRYDRQALRLARAGGGVEARAEEALVGRAAELLAAGRPAWTPFANGAEQALELMERDLERRSASS